MRAADDAAGLKWVAEMDADAKREAGLKAELDAAVLKKADDEAAELKRKADVEAEMKGKADLKTELDAKLKKMGEKQPEAESGANGEQSGTEKRTEDRSKILLSLNQLKKKFTTISNQQIYF